MVLRKGSADDNALFTFKWYFFCFKSFLKTLMLFGARNKAKNFLRSLRCHPNADVLLWRKVSPRVGVSF